MFVVKALLPIMPSRLQTSETQSSIYKCRTDDLFEAKVPVGSRCAKVPSLHV